MLTMMLKTSSPSKTGLVPNTPIKIVVELLLLLLSPALLDL